MSLAKADASGKKTAFITGAASGIGKAIAVRLATREAYAVSIVDRSEQAIEAVVSAEGPRNCWLDDPACGERTMLNS